MAMDDEPRGLRVDEAARIAECSEPYIYKAIRLGRLRATTYTRGAQSEWRIDEESLKEWKKTLKRAKPPRETPGRPVPVGAPA